MRYVFIPFDESSTEGVYVPEPHSYKDCIRLLQSDYYRVYGRIASFGVIWLHSIRNHCIKYLLWMRLSSYRSGLFYPLCKIRQEHYGKKYGLDIPPSTLIGWGFYLGHGISIVVNCTAIIGNNVNISQCCTIGSNNGHAALIGDNVYIGPNTCIVERVSIGSNTVIGAGSVVTNSIRQGSCAVGVPCREVGRNRHLDYIKNRWI